MAFHTQFRFYGASPDGLVLDHSSKLQYDTLDIKCTFNAYMMSKSVAEARRLPGFCCALGDDGPIHLRPNHDYNYQVQSQMAICQVSWCDFFV